MKISKLFHWLYAFLMLLPVFALMPSMFYFAFNEKAENYTNQTITEEYEYETNEVNSNDDLIVGNIYLVDLVGLGHIYQTDALTDDIYLGIVKNENLMINIYNGNTEIDEHGNDNSLYSSVIEFFDGSILYTVYANYQYTSYYTNAIYSDDLFVAGVSNWKVYCIFLENSTLDYIDHSNYFSESDYLGEKSVNITESEQSPMSIFYTSVDKIFTMPIFAWAKTSFLVAPFTFIGNLFGLQTTSPIIYMLSYWLAMSIVWLVFDLIMYVPLLVHRWIDKGIVE